LIAAAAELRAGGHSWESVAKELRRSVKTCQNWPSKRPREWAEYFRPAQLRLWEQMVMEARAHLHAFMRDEDKKWSYKANELIMKHSAATYGPSGTATHPELKPAATGNPNEEIHQRLSRVLDEARERIDRKRQREGKPPVNNTEFMEEWKKDVESRPPKKEPIKVYFNEHGEAIDPPGEGTTPADAKFDQYGTLIPPDRPPPVGAAPAAAAGLARDVVWGVLLLAAILTGRSGPADGDRGDTRTARRATSGQLVASNERSPRPPGREFLPGRGVRGRDVDVQRLQRPLAGVSDFVTVATLDQDERSPTQRDPLAVHNRFSRSADDEQPLVGAAMTVVRPALGRAGLERHLGGLRPPVPERDAEPAAEAKVGVAHARSRKGRVSRFVDTIRPTEAEAAEAEAQRGRRRGLRSPPGGAGGDLAALRPPPPVPPGGDSSSHVERAGHDAAGTTIAPNASCTGFPRSFVVATDTQRKESPRPASTHRPTKKEQIVSLFSAGVGDIADIAMITGSRPSYVSSVLSDAGLHHGYFDLYTSTNRPMNVYSKFFAGGLGFKDVETARRSVGLIDRLHRQFEIAGDRAGQHHALMMALTMFDRARWTNKTAEAEVFRVWLMDRLADAEPRPTSAPTAVRSGEVSPSPTTPVPKSR
jgi:hypothetical protein